MNKRARLELLIIIIIILCTGLSFSQSFVYATSIDEEKDILVINSYNQGMTWTKDVTDGIIEVLKKNNNYSVHVEDMDWKNYPDGDNINRLYDYFLYKYKGKHLSMIITSDDTALQFASDYRDSLFPGTPIVFCGVNQSSVKNLTLGHKGITGVLEEIDPTETVKMALEINPNLKSIYVLFDNSESGKSAGQLVIDKVKQLGSNLNTKPLNNLTYDELINDVASYDSNSIILVTTYSSDVNGRLVEYEGATKEISQKSSVPVYHLYDFGLNNGAIGGAMMSGRLQGIEAANLAIRVMNGENPDDIPVIFPQTTRKVFDYNQLKRFNIPLSKVNKDYEVINKPFSFFETYRWLVVGAGTVFLILVFFAVFLFIETRKSKKAEKKLTHLAYHDALTGLPNKLSLLQYTDLPEDGKSALLFIDVDNFKYINDTLGHGIGDSLVYQISKRLISLLRGNCLAFRLSGDEFIVIIQEIRDINDARQFAGEVLKGFEDDFDIMNINVNVTLSIGIALYPDQGGSISELIKFADVAMYKAKDEGRNRYEIYNQEMYDAFLERVNIERSLHKAIDHGEFSIVYQPQYDLKTGSITGIEALLRWTSPELGKISPVKFIKAAENTHLIIPLGTWVLNNACSFLNKLHKEGFNDVTVSVNISMIQLLQTDFFEIVMDAIIANCIKPEHLELEITESILMESYETICTGLDKLREAGVKIALDDFGKGYSSLSYLKLLPISTLKIDKTFIDGINNESIVLTGQIISLGNSLGISVIAEGVETLAQLEYLKNHGCSKIQGNYFSEPLNEEELTELLKNNYFNDELIG